jgi:hypothetical protein
MFEFHTDQSLDIPNDTSSDTDESLSSIDKPTSIKPPPLTFIDDLPIFDRPSKKDSQNKLGDILRKSASNYRVEPKVQRFMIMGGIGDSKYSEEFEYIICLSDDDETIKELIGIGRYVMIRRLIKRPSDRVSKVGEPNGTIKVLEFIERWAEGYRIGRSSCRASYIQSHKSKVEVDKNKIWTAFCYIVDGVVVKRARLSRLNDDPVWLQEMIDILGVEVAESVPSINRSDSSIQI